ncbi:MULTISPECIES: hypothetical protein [Bacillaceae]|uniref:Uncharacterized protein n=1 Tax=Alkalicoccobacillus plakortidis TaxID=444060 RepID=A0A9D5DL41_9BACI|nr:MULTISPECIES: hypothetical protein [Bacillaceae]KQL55938.1 hypothetical protein AN965_16825 [Alkalicoccobacillus plakortidis]
MNENDKFIRKTISNFGMVQQQQYEKGIKKYGAPFNPDHFNQREVSAHAFEELADLLVYVYGMSEKLSKQEQKINKLQTSLKLVRNEALRESPDRDRINQLYRAALSLTDVHMF